MKFYRPMYAAKEMIVYSCWKNEQVFFTAGLFTLGFAIIFLSTFFAPHKLLGSRSLTSWMRSGKKCRILSIFVLVSTFSHELWPSNLHAEVAICVTSCDGNSRANLLSYELFALLWDSKPIPCICCTINPYPLLNDNA